MDKQACKSIICHADNITDEISPGALSFNFAETFAGDLTRDVFQLGVFTFQSCFLDFLVPTFKCIFSSKLF